MTLKLDKNPIELDTNQMKAVEHFEGPAVVVAGPGSGKTTVIKKRILNLIEKYKVTPWKILALAFNKEAINEIARRVLEELGPNYPGRPKIRTLHGFGKDIVTSNYKRAGFETRPETKQDKIQNMIDEERKQIEREITDTPVYIYKIEDLITKTCYIGRTTNLNRRKEEHDNRSSNDELWQVGLKEGANKTLFEQIDTTSYSEADEREAYWIQHYRELPGGIFNQSDPVRRRYINQAMIELFCQHFDISCDTLLKRQEDFKDLTDLFDKMQDEVKKAKRQVETGLFRPESIDNEAVRIFAQRYEEVKAKVNTIDFEDMLIYSAYTLENSDALRQHYRNRYAYVLVDEFQDISPADFRLISQLSKNLFAVGDDDQAIYGFRGGNSEIMQTFYNRGDVSKYKVTRNYRSTATIVKYAKALIEYNKDCRISKDLSAKNPRQFPIKILETTPKTAEKNLLTQFTEPVCQTQLVQKHFPIPKNILLPKLESKTAILTRTNAEVDKIKKMIEKLTLGVKKDIEVSTIHKVKGQEYDRVILIVNTLDVWETDKPYNSLPTDQNDENEEQRVFDVHEERRVFYVAMTRAKYELIVLGRNCQFISEFQNAPPTTEELEEAFRVELAAREPKLKIELEEASKAALVALGSKLKKELEEASKLALKQHEPELNRLRREASEIADEVNEMELTFTKQLKTTNDAFIEGLIPVLDEFESQINSLPTTGESNKVSDDFEVFTESVQLAYKQMLDSLKNHGIRSIETVGRIFNPSHHEKVSSDIYSDEVQTGRIAKEEQRGYLLHDQVVRKAQVVISKRKQQADVFLSQDFAQPVRFVTYTGLRDLRNIETFKDGVKGLDSQDKEVQLQSLNLLFAFPKEDMKALKPSIKKWLVIANRNLQPIALISERFHVADDILKQLLIEQDAIGIDVQKSTVRVTARSGHVLNGHLWDFDEDFLYMKINTKDVIVYRSGVLRFVNLTWNEITKAYKNRDPIDGYVTKRVRDGFQVKFRSLTGFLPASQVELSTTQHLNSYIGKTYEMMVIEVNEANNHFVLSRRAWLKEQNAKLLKSLSEVSEEPPNLRNIKRMSKTVEAIPRTNRFLHAPEAERIPLDKSISVMVPEPVAEVIDTLSPISTEITESSNTYVKDFKPETHQTVEVRRIPLHEPINLIIPEPVKEVVDSRLPMPKDCLEIPDSQFQNLAPEILEIEIAPKPLDTVHSNSPLTSQEYEDILKKQIQDIKSDVLEPDIVSYPPIAVNNSPQETPQEYEDILKEQIQDIKSDTFESENPDNITQEPTMETEVNSAPVDSTALTRSEPSTVIDRNASQIKEQDIPENKVEDVKKSLGYYLRQGRRFAGEKIKATIFRKPNS